MRGSTQRRDQRTRLGLASCRKQAVSAVSGSSSGVGRRRFRKDTRGIDRQAEPCAAAASELYGHFSVSVRGRIQRRDKRALLGLPCRYLFVPAVSGSPSGVGWKKFRKDT